MKKTNYLPSSAALLTTILLSLAILWLTTSLSTAKVKIAHLEKRLETLEMLTK